MKKYIFLYSFLLSVSPFYAQKSKVSENVVTIKENIYVLTNENADFWTNIGIEKGREFLLESIFLEEGDHVSFYMEDLKTPFKGNFASEEGAILDIIPQKTKEGTFRYRGSHKVEASGEYFWKFLVLNKNDFLINPKLTLILSKSDNKIYRQVTSIKSQLEYLIAMATSRFVPIMGDFMEKDIKETRYKSTYAFQSKKGEVVHSKKGYHYQTTLYYGDDPTAAKQARIQVEDNIIEAMKENCYTEAKTTTKPPYSLFKEYYRTSFEGCGHPNTEVNLYHYLKRGKYTVQLEIIFNQ